MATKLEYNGIDLGLVKTVRIQQEPHWDDSHTDVLWFDFTLSVETIFAVNTNLSTIPVVDGAVAIAVDDLIAELRHMLMVPRRDLTYRVSGIAGRNMFSVGAVGGVANANDANNGPQPVSCDIVQVTPQTLKIAYTVKFALAECDTQTDFASNRWEESHDYDEKGYLTIHRTGTLWVRSDMRRNPDAMRAAVLPPLLPDFVRKTSYRVTKDGLALQYAITDVQKYLLPPKGCVDMRGRLAITTPNGGLFYAQVELTLEGRRGMPKKELMQLCSLMAFQKLMSVAPVKDGNNQPLVIQGGWDESLHDNVVTVTLRAMLNQSRKVINPGNNIFKEAGKAIFNIGVGGVGGPAGQVVRDGIKIYNYLASDNDLAKEIARVYELDVKLAQANANREARALLAAPPSERIGFPLVTPDGIPMGQGAAGIDPGLRGDGEFLIAVADTFYDPCLRREAKLKKPNDKLDAARNKLKPQIVDELRGGKIGNGNGDLGGGRIRKAEDAIDWPEEDIEAAILDLDGAALNTKAGESVLRSFALVDSVERFEVEEGLAGGDPFPGVYEHWFCNIEDEVNTNATVLPATVEGLPNKKFRMANDVMTTTITWTVSKVCYPPQIPVIADENLVVKTHKIDNSEVGLASDGQSLVFESTGRTVVQSLDPKKVAIRWPVPPWMRLFMADIKPPVPYPLHLSTEAETSGIRSLQSGQGSTLKTPNA